MVAAEPIIQHNWTDVAIHDRDRLKRIPVGHYCYWVVTQMGSYLTPAYCKLNDRARWYKDSVAAIQLLVIRWHGQAHHFGSSAAWREFHDPVRDKHCFMIVKTDSSNGRVEPMKYKDLADMVVYKKRPMVAPRQA